MVGECAQVQTLYTSFLNVSWYQMCNKTPSSGGALSRWNLSPLGLVPVDHMWNELVAPVETIEKKVDSRFRHV